MRRATDVMPGTDKSYAGCLASAKETQRVFCNLQKAIAKTHEP